MIVVRNVFQAKFGKAAELARYMAEDMKGIAQAYGSGTARVLTDLSGQFDTVVLEIEIESLAAWEEQRRKAFASPEFAQGMSRSAGLVEGGRVEFYTLEG